MSQSLSWIDSAALQDALSRAHVAPGSGRPTALGAGLRFTAPAAPAAPPAAPIEAPTVFTPSPPPAAPSVRPRGSMVERIRSLAVWVEGELGPERWFLADEEGLALHAAGATEMQIVSSVALTRAMRSLRRFLGDGGLEAVTLRMEGGQVLHTLWCDTKVGRVALGMFNPRVDSQDALRSLRDGVSLALGGPGSQAR